MSHESHDHPPELFDQEFWDARYGTAEAIWSGQPNLRLVEQVAGLPPGTALDVGCGEGADAVWLAAQGWQVTGVDISPVALGRAPGHAAAAGPEVAARITWRQADVLSWVPPTGEYDLVSAQFMQLPRKSRASFHRQLADAVRPGGTLLVVAHHPFDLETTARRPHLADLVFTPEEVAATLDHEVWQVIVSAAPEREAIDPEGKPITIRDSVLRARRRG